jgi:hypothetical protein
MLLAKLIQINQHARVELRFEDPGIGCDYVEEKTERKKGEKG